MRRVARAVAWGVLVLALVGTAFYVGLLVHRRVSPPIVPVDRANTLARYRTGDAVLVARVTTSDLAAGDLVAARVHGSVVVGRLEATEPGRYKIVGTGPNVVEVDSRDVVGTIQRRIPLAGWLLLAARNQGIQILAGMAVVGFVVLLVFTGRAPLPFFDDEDDDDPPPMLALPAGAPIAYVARAMSISPDELRQVRFALQRKGGYDTAAVDEALDKVADHLDVLLQERFQLIDRLRTLEAELEKLRAGAPALNAGPTAADGTMVELLGETRAIRSLLQAVLTQGGQLGHQPPAPPPH